MKRTDVYLCTIGKDFEEPKQHMIAHKGIVFANTYTNLATDPNRLRRITTLLFPSNPNMFNKRWLFNGKN